MDVYLTEPAFISLVVSTIEVYRRACCGILLGHRQPDRILVDFAVPYQSAHRTFQEVRMPEGRSQRVADAVRAASQATLVGQYHSQCQGVRRRGTTRLLRADRGTRTQDGVSVVVAINDSRRHQAWGYGKKGLIAGSLNGYSLRIAAYLQREHAVVRVPLICPYAIGFATPRVTSG